MGNSPCSPTTPKKRLGRIPTALKGKEVFVKLVTTFGAVDHFSVFRA